MLMIVSPRTGIVQGISFLFASFSIVIVGWVVYIAYSSVVSWWWHGERAGLIVRHFLFIGQFVILYYYVVLMLKKWRTPLEGVILLLFCVCKWRLIPTLWTIWMYIQFLYIYMCKKRNTLFGCRFFVFLFIGNQIWSYSWFEVYFCCCHSDNFLIELLRKWKWCNVMHIYVYLFSYIHSGIISSYRYKCTCSYFIN